MDKEEPNPQQDENLIIVGVGASAGGLEAFSELLRHLPPATGMAFVLVQHLDPRHESALSELLAAKTQMQVLQVHNETRILPDHVYVIPPNTLMRVHNRTLVLETRPTTSDTFRPIDVFFNSLGEELHFNAIGVVLSGTASDGTLGLKTIKAEGGITFAQNQTAKFESMPRSAISAGVVDFVLPPRRIAEELAAISRRAQNLTPAETVWTGDGATLHRIQLMLRNQTGVDFTQYKQPTILRRLNRRMLLQKTENLEQYYEILQKEPGEVRALFDDLLINVTDFFRDPDVFESAKRVAFPGIVQEHKQPQPIRVWVPGCSTGEEVYSIVIALLEFLESEDLDRRIQVFGTDVSEITIAKARMGIYSESGMGGVSPERLRRFFVRADSGYQISRAVREMCVFSRHNVAKDPPLSRMDLISCRNLLIYFSPALQKRIIGTFSYALLPAGCLILGSSEALGSLAGHFTTLDEKHKIYRKTTTAVESALPMPEVSVDYVPGTVPATASRPALEEPATPLHRFVNEVVMSRLGPVGLVVNEGLRITEYRGAVNDYLVTPKQEPGALLMDVLREDLRAPVSAAIEQARRTQVVVVAEGLPGSAADRGGAGAITVVPISLSGIPLHFLILLGRSSETVGLPADAAAGRESSAPAMSAEDQNARLKLELKSTREYLQSVIEELRSANEEAQSSNEELQSTNEEMQTSKEELQSSNEELNTINTEMQSRNAELKQINDDLVNLLGSMNMPIVMTDAELRIRRFTPVAEKSLRLIATDVGRPISDLKPRINVPNLEEILERVLETLQPCEMEVHDREGRSYLMRVRPYRTTDNRIDGTVLQLLDVTDLNRSLQEVKHARDYAEAIVNTIREPLAVLEQNYAIRNANQAFYDLVELPREAIVGKSIFEAGRGRFDLPPIHALIERLDQGAPPPADVEVEHRPPRGEARTFVVNATRFRTPDQGQYILLALEDVTERKRVAEVRYRRLFESARDGIVLVNADSGEILDLNPFVEHLFGYRREELAGHKLWEIDFMREVPKIQAAFQQIRDRGVFRFDDVVLRTKDGRDLVVEIIANLYLEGDRRAIQFNMRDISERKKFERDLQESEKLEGLGILAGGIAHDFNNLLTGILGHSSLALSDVPADHPARRQLRQIIEAAERAAFLTRQMLAYAGKGRFVIANVDLGDAVRETAALVRTSMPKSVELNLDLAPGLPPIEGDPGQIQQVIINLVMNGAEAIGENESGRVTVRTSVCEIDGRNSPLLENDVLAPGTYVQMEVIDTGSGMDEATKARIFDPFFSTKFMGRGLGLAAVQGIVRGHRGVLRVYSTPGQGTTFLVLFPAAGPAHRVTPEPDAESDSAGSVVLVVDAEPAIRSFAEDVLSRAGRKALTAESGKIALELFRQHRPAVVVLDLQMPAMGGLETLKRLREISPDVPVILTGGMEESEAEKRFSSLQPARFLQKPYTAQRLARAVADVVRHA